MFDELSINSADYQAPRLPLTNQVPTEIRELEALVSQVLQIETRQYPAQDRLAVAFIGELLVESAQAFEQVDAQLEPRDLLPQFSRLEEGEFKGKIQVLILRERPNPQPRPWWPNALLLFLTILSLLWSGSLLEGVEQSFDNLIMKGQLLQGWVYALSLLLILGSHELGHYFMSRYYGVNQTLPYFIPFPNLIGTMGAVILQREFTRNRRQLFDIGIAGPLAGLVFAVPILIMGVMTAEVNPLPTSETCQADNSCVYLLEGNSLLYGGIKYLVHGRWLPDALEDMTLNQMSLAGWTGLLVTAINLVPLGQLDGGHVFYSIMGQKAKFAFTPILGVFLALLLVNPMFWFLWVMLIFFFGRIYNVPLDDVTPLDNRRRLLGMILFVILILIFTPNPMSIVDVTP